MIYLFENIFYNHSLGTVIKGGKEFKLTKIQRKLLKYLLDNPQEIISKQVLMDQVWQRTVTENSIDQRVADLRNIVELDRTEPKIISTNFGQGFFLNCEVAIDNTANKPQPSEKPASSHKLYLSLMLLLTLLVIFFIYWTQYRNEPNSENNTAKITAQISKQDYMNQFPVDKRQAVTEMYAVLPRATRKKFRRFLSNVSDKKKQGVTLELLTMTEAERIEYIHTL